MLTFVSASTFSLDRLAALYTQTFAGYAYDILVTPDELREWIRVEDLDLNHSPVLCVEGEAVGLATVGVRGAATYCRSFGVIPDHRGRGLALRLAEEMLRQGRAAGGAEMILGVLKTNTGAVRTYQRVGFQVRRDLLSLSWQAERSRPTTPSLRSAAPADLLARFDALHPARPIWYRDLASLQKRDALVGLALEADADVVAYALVQPLGDGAADILDLGLADPGQAPAMIAALQSRYRSLTLGNEPDDSPVLTACRAAGFVVTHERYEMLVDLT